MAVTVKPAHEPPDGGYAWVIMAAYAFNTILGIQMKGIGLVFKDMFSEMDMPATDVAIILNLNLSLSLLLGIFTGALIRKFGYRKVAAAGALLTCAGLLLTSVATTFIDFVIYFSIITAAGLGLTAPSFSVAFHSYFRRRRSMASSVLSTLIGVVGIACPQVIGLLLREYGPRGTCVMLAGYALNVLVAAALLHPVSWHSRAASNPDVKVLVEDAVEESTPVDDFALPPLPVLMEETDADLRSELLGSLGSMRRRASTVSSYHTARRPSEASNTMWASASILDMVCSKPGGLDQAPALDKLPKSPSSKDEPPAPPRAPRTLREDVRLCWRFLVDFFGLDLLANPSIANIMLGLALGLFGQGNFNQFLPFIFAERGLSTTNIVNIMSLMAVASTVTKLLAPLLQRLLRQSSRVMCAATLVMLVAGQIALALVRDDTAVFAIAVTLGSINGFNIVYYIQVLPDSVPPEDLASAIGLQAVLGGVVMLVCGPLIGVIRDQSGSYDMVIMTCCVFTLVCITMWLVEFITAAVKGHGRGHGRGRGRVGDS
ncbi:uncharacterized protein LOC113213510 [Frankliniella occidentalis]|uniref:Uncharacterized protein LOC113213510 n=1 Tax=Frankliniella occidentalis TaxID=133901 RepID=A0A6J1TC75_FRAOC|nr:uncharacterized protein LOC113213510 [Frankliniella occidentalis]